MQNWLSKELLEIIGVTLYTAFFSTTISALLGIPLGLWLDSVRMPGKRIIVRINRTLMGTPPVVVGLVVYLLLMRKGPLGALELLFTVPAMVVAQMLIITPIISGQIFTAAQSKATAIRAFGKTMGVNRTQALWLLVKEMRNEIYFAIITGFGRSISEVGAVMIVGGNIEHKTRTMTTAITLLRNKGNYKEAIILGLTLLTISFVAQAVADTLRSTEEMDENI